MYFLICFFGFQTIELSYVYHVVVFGRRGRRQLVSRHLLMTFANFSSNLMIPCISLIGRQFLRMLIISPSITGEAGAMCLSDIYDNNDLKRPIRTRVNDVSNQN